MARGSEHLLGCVGGRTGRLRGGGKRPPGSGTGAQQLSSRIWRRRRGSKARRAARRDLPRVNQSSAQGRTKRRRRAAGRRDERRKWSGAVQPKWKPGRARPRSGRARRPLRDSGLHFPSGGRRGSLPPGAGRPGRSPAAAVPAGEAGLPPAAPPPAHPPRGCRRPWGGRGAPSEPAGRRRPGRAAPAPPAAEPGGGAGREGAGRGAEAASCDPLPAPLKQPHAAGRPPQSRRAAAEREPAAGWPGQSVRSLPARPGPPGGGAGG